jgi:hypothetical protein
LAAEHSDGTPVEIPCPTAEDPADIADALIYVASEADRKHKFTEARDLLVAGRPVEAADSVVRTIGGDVRTAVALGRLPAAVNCIISKFWKHSLSDPESRFNGMGSRKVISRYVNLTVKGQEDSACALLVEPILDSKEDRTGSEPDSRIVLALLELLNDVTNTEGYAYGVTPHNLAQRIALEASRAEERSLLLQTAGRAAGDKDSALLNILDQRNHTLRKIEGQPLVVGFGTSFMTSPSLGEGQKIPIKPQFGWVIAPRVTADAISGDERLAQTHQQYSLSAVLSLPSWWKHVELAVKVCWQRAFRLGETALGKSDVCEIAPAHVQTIKLPGTATEVSTKLGFSVLQQPRLERSELPPVVAGREAEILLQGERLWRSMMVTLGGQTASEITILPNMKGILARLNVYTLCRSSTRLLAIKGWLSSPLRSMFGRAREWRPRR